MDIIHFFINFILHIDHHLTQMIAEFGPWTYAILFLIVFCETGLVVTPFLPGDSLIFAAGTLAARSELNIHIVFITLIVAALCGDNVNYWIGRCAGPKVFHYEKSRFFKKKYLDKTHAFFEKYGGKAVIIARFVPILRTFSPFVAGIGAMTYKKFLTFSVIAAIVWVGLIGYISYWFGNLSLIRNNFTYVIFAIIIISLLPPVIEYLRHRVKKTNCS